MSGGRGGDGGGVVGWRAAAAGRWPRRRGACGGVGLGGRAARCRRSGVGSLRGRGGGRGGGAWVCRAPPYPLDDPALSAVLGKLAHHLAPAAVVVVERSTRSPEPFWPAGLEQFAEKKYGETRLWFAEPSVLPED